MGGEFIQARFVWSVSVGMERAVLLYRPDRLGWDYVSAVTAAEVVGKWMPAMFHGLFLFCQRLWKTPICSLVYSVMIPLL